MPPEVQQAYADPRRIFGRFVILGELGRGGMGVVYKAWDGSLGRPVALKVLQEGAGDVAVERFRREALAVARVRHPGIVAVHDAGMLAGRAYLAMDFIDGTTLDRRMKAEPKLPLARGVEIIRDVAHAIQHAHDNGVVHRDLKPQNVMLDASERPYVVDFGLALLGDGESALTRTGATIGTPAYMPPEQTESRGEVDNRTDVYALGATLYFVIAGRPPFIGESEVIVLTAVLTRDPPPPSKFNRRALGDLDTICLKCLDKDPSRRYATARDLAHDLDRYLAGESIVARPLGPVTRTFRKLRRNLVAVAVVLLALLVSASALAWPFVRGELSSRRRRAATERTNLAAKEKAKHLHAELGTKLERFETPSLAGREEREVAALASLALATVAPIENEAALRKELHETATTAAAGELKPDEIEAAVDASLPEVARPRLLARASRAAARAYRRLRLAGLATREGARAYRLDPSGPDGAGAFLDLAEALLERNDWKRALELFTTLSSRPIDEGLRARADLGAARALLPLDELDQARARLARALASGKLDPVSLATARWVAAVADRLALPTTEPTQVPVPALFLRTAPGEGPPDTHVVLENETLIFRRVDGAGRFPETARAPLPAGRHGSPVFMKSHGQTFVATIAYEPKLALQVFRREGTVLELEREVPLAPLEWACLRSTVDLSGTGQDDLVLGSRIPGLDRDGVSVLRDPLGRAELVTLPLGRCDGHDVAVVRFDGPGPGSIIVQSRHWEGFCVRVFERDADDRIACVFTRVLGEPSGLVVGKTGDREYLVVGGDREEFADAVFDDDPELGRDTPDGVWKLWRREGKLELQALLTRPFEQRLTGGVSARAIGIVPGYPEAVTAGQWGPELAEGNEECRQVVFVAPPPLPPVFAGRGRGRRWVDMAYLPDLDGDGVHEVAFWLGNGWVVSGLRALGAAPAPGPVVERPPAEATPLDVDLDLLACGEPQAAARELEQLIARPDTQPSDRARARLARARALLLLGRAEEARRGLQELADTEPRLAREALLLSAGAAEEEGRYADAVSDLERLVSREPLAQDDVEVHRRLRRLRPLTELTEQARIDRKTLAKLPFTVTNPLGTRLTESGIFFRSAPGADANLDLPLDFSASALRVKVKIRALHMGFDSGFGVRFHAPGYGLGLGGRCDGGGNVSTWHRGVGGVNFARIDPEEPMTLEMTYVPSEDRVRSLLVHGLERSEQVFDAPPMIGGQASIHVGCSSGAGRCSFELEEIAVLAQRDCVRPRETEASPEEKELASAFRSYALGDFAPAAKALVLLADGAHSDDVRKRAACVACFALAEAGQEDEAKERLAGLLATSPEAAEPAFQNVAALSDRSRRVLASAYAKRYGPAIDALETRTRNVPRDRPGEIAVALLAARARDRGPGPAIDEATAWREAGDDETALEILKTIGTVPEARLMAGLCAANLERLELALEEWQGLDLGPLVLPYRRRAERLLAPAKAR